MSSDGPRFRRSYSSQFRAEAVQLVVSSGRPVAHVAKELGIGPQMLGRWVHQWRQEHPDPSVGPSPVEAARVKELEAEVARLALENDFVKKAAAFFARTLP
jgi:transposase-like protein